MTPHPHPGIPVPLLSPHPAVFNLQGCFQDSIFPSVLPCHLCVCEMLCLLLRSRAASLLAASALQTLSRCQVACSVPSRRTLECVTIVSVSYTSKRWGRRQVIPTSVPPQPWHLLVLLSQVSGRFHSAPAPAQCAPALPRDGVSAQAAPLRATPKMGSVTQDATSPRPASGHVSSLPAGAKQSGQTISGTVLAGPGGPVVCFKWAPKPECERPRP